MNTILAAMAILTLGGQGTILPKQNKGIAPQGRN